MLSVTEYKSNYKSVNVEEMFAMKKELNTPGHAVVSKLAVEINTSYLGVIAPPCGLGE